MTELRHVPLPGVETYDADGNIVPAPPMFVRSFPFLERMAEAARREPAIEQFLPPVNPEVLAQLQQERKEREQRACEDQARKQAEREAQEARMQAILDELGGNKLTELGEDHQVSYTAYGDGTASVDIDGYDARDALVTFAFAPQQALELLAWLDREKPVLERLARIQDEGKHEHE